MPATFRLAARRALTTLFASFALLCAQMAPTSDVTPTQAGTSVTAGHAKAQVARLSNGLTLAKIEGGAAPHAKSAPPLDALLATAPAVAPRSDDILVGHAVIPTRTASAAARPYQARAPPAERPSIVILQPL